MLGDTLTITLPVGGAKVLNKVDGGNNYASEYLLKDTLSEFRAKVRHSKTSAGKDRHNIELVETVYATATEVEFTRKVYIVWENEPADVDYDNIDGLADYLTVGANLAALMGWES